MDIPIRTPLFSILGRLIVNSINSGVTTFVLMGVAVFPGFSQAQGLKPASCEKIFSPPSAYEQVMGLHPHSYYESVEPYLNNSKSVDMVASAIVDRQTETVYRSKAEDAKSDELWKNDPNWQSMSATYMKFDPKKADIIIFFPIEHHLSILKKGFLNQYQTGESMGHYDPKIREKIEDGLAQLKLGSSKASAKLRPKYGIVNFREDLPFSGEPRYARREAQQNLPPRDDHYYVFQDIARTYGGVAAVMKSKVKRHATFTSHDTRAAGGGTQPQRINTFQAEYMRVWSTDLYHEAQIYGNLSAKDIDYFLVQDVKLAEALKVFGLPIYEVEQSYIGYRVVFRKGKRLF